MQKDNKSAEQIATLDIDVKSTKKLQILIMLMRK